VQAARSGGGRRPVTERHGYRSALGHRDFRLMLTAAAISSVGSWAYNVALWVWIYDQTGSAGWVAVSSTSRFVPALVLSSYGGVVSERFERTTVMRWGDTSMGVAMALLALTAALGGPVVVGILLAALTTAAGVANTPSALAMVPQVVEERDLAAANALYRTVDNLAIVAGPALGALLLTVGTPATSFAVNAGTFFVSVALVTRMSARSSPTDVTLGGRAGPLAQVMVGVRAIGSSVVATTLVGFLVMSYLLYGITPVLFVVLLDERLTGGTNGLGYLLMGAGLGGLLAAGFLNRLAARPRLGRVILVGVVLYLVPLALLAFVSDLRLAIGLQVVRGVGMLTVDVLAITALQRTLAPELVSRVFGVFRSFALGALVLGALVAPPLLRLVGLEVTLLLFGIGLPVGVAAASWPWARRMDLAMAPQAVALDPSVRILESLGIFAAAPRPVVERLALAATPAHAAAGQPIVQQGEPADALYVLTSGEVVVQVTAALHGMPRPRDLVTLQAPTYFGELGLLDAVPRTATVRAVGPCELLRIEGDDFLAALSEAPASEDFLATVRHRGTSADGHRAVAPAPEP
jgi:MFS family permease